MCVYVPHACLETRMPHEDQKRCQVLWNWIYKYFWAAMSVLWVNPRPLEGQSVLLTTELTTKAPTWLYLYSNLSSSWSALEMAFTHPFEVSLCKYTTERNPFVAVGVDPHHLNHPLKPHLPKSEETLNPLYRMSWYFHITYTTLPQLKIISQWFLTTKTTATSHLESGGNLKKKSAHAQYKNNSFSKSCHQVWLNPWGQILRMQRANCTSLHKHKVLFPHFLTQKQASATFYPAPRFHYVKLFGNHEIITQTASPFFKFRSCLRHVCKTTDLISSL